jgi:hypothetical protein
LINSAGRLKEALKEYGDDTPLLWQFYTSDHAGIPASDFEAVSSYLMDDQVFLEDHHQFISDWLETIHTQLKEGNQN